MVSCSADDAGQILTISHSGHVTRGQVEACLKSTQDSMEHLRPGFVLLGDLTNLESMDDTCATALGAIMELCSSRGVTAIVRVIPDPSKDIGFNLISLFHFQKPVRTYECRNLAEAMKYLLAEFPSATAGR
jgi:anti-anti-sigma regulatory factor